MIKDYKTTVAQSVIDSVALDVLGSIPGRVLKYIINVVCCVGRVEIQMDLYKKVGVLPIRIV